MKQYEKVAFVRFFGLFLGSFLLLFLLLGTLYFFYEQSRLLAELDIVKYIEYPECKQFQMPDCEDLLKKEPNLQAIFMNLLYALGLVMLFFLPISFFLARFSLKPVRQASTMIDNFIANIVHDINTPIATIMLNAKSLLKRSKEEPKKLTRILSSAKQLTDMQHDLLALADENNAIEKEELELKTLVEELVEGFKLQYSHQPFELSVQEQTVSVNPVDLRRIIQNLISNAVKYNQDDNVIKIYTQEQKLIIQDQGKGMAHPEKVFEKNYREDYSIQGNGLGLASVLSMLERNNIVIKVTSELNKGTTISLNFC